MLTINPKEIPVPKLHSYLLGAVIPRPIALASTVDAQGNVNLSPFSFFNVFSTNPPVLIFSPSRRGRDNTVKHTYENVKATGEAVVNIVTYAMVEQVSLASCEYPRGVNEFIKAGLTEEKSQLVRPPRVAESPVSFECKVMQVIELGTGGSAGNLVVCEILRIHIQERVLDPDGRINPHKMDAVARLGADYYARIQGDAIFKVPKPNEKLGIGFDALPEDIRRSEVLTGNDLAQLANVEHIPASDGGFNEAELKALRSLGRKERHAAALRHLRSGELNKAWQVLLLGI